MKEKQLQIHGFKILVTFKKMKTIRLKFNQKTGEFSISAPNHLTIKLIENFAISKIDWIKNQQEKFNLKPLTQKLQYISGELHWFLGEQFKVMFNENLPKEFQQINYENLTISLGTKLSRFNNEQILYSFYKSQLQNILPDSFSYWENIVGKKANMIKIRKMKSRWGSCNVVSKNITINLELIKHPKENIEHVILHELVHLLERNHSKRFYAYLDLFQPDWKKIDLDIKRRGLLDVN